MLSFSTNEEFGVKSRDFYFFCRFVLGMITLGNLMAQIVGGKVTPESPVSQCIYRKFKKVCMYQCLSVLQRINPFPKRHKLVHNGRFPKFEALYCSLNMVSSTEIS